MGEMDSAQARRQKQLVNLALEKMAPKLQEFEPELRQIRSELGE